MSDCLPAIADEDRESFSVFYRRHLPVVSHISDERPPAIPRARLLIWLGEVFASVLLFRRGAYIRAEHASAVPWIVGVGAQTCLARVRRAQSGLRIGHDAGLGWCRSSLTDEDLEAGLGAGRQ